MHKRLHVCWTTVCVQQAEHVSDNLQYRAAAQGWLDWWKQFWGIEDKLQWRSGLDTGDLWAQNRTAVEICVFKHVTKTVVLCGKFICMRENVSVPQPWRRAGMMWQSTRDLMLFSVPMARLPSTTAHSVRSSRLDELCWSRYNNLEPMDTHTHKSKVTVKVLIGCAEKFLVVSYILVTFTVFFLFCR